MDQKLSITDLPINGKKVLMRVDFNVPVDERGHITDDSRIQAAIPSIKYVLDQGGALILMSHFGRPKGRVDSKYSLRPCAERLSELLHIPVKLAPNCIGKEVEQLAASLKPGQILMLENLRFHKGEEHPHEEPEFAKQLASLADFYVDEAFGAAHRMHASVCDITAYFPKRSAAGFLMQKEISFLGNTLLQPKRPFIALIGGAKISTKLGVVKALLGRVNHLLIGGGMSYTFLKAQQIPIGDSIYEEDLLEDARMILEESKQECTQLVLPVDLVVADKIGPDAKTLIVDVSEGIPNGFQGVDIGPKTLALYKNILMEGKTIFWNGPVGVFECPPFAQGTYEIAQFLGTIPATTIVGGGDSIAAIHQAHVADKIAHLSTGGGASLEFIEQGSLPGIDALSNKQDLNNGNFS